MPNKDVIEPIPDTMENVVNTLVTLPLPPSKKTGDNTQGELPLIEHKVSAISVDQRANDGYVNATALCQASGKQLGHYLETKATQAFLAELSADIGIPISELVQIIKGGNPKMQGTWVHHLDSTWIVVTDKSAKDIRDTLRKHIDDDDELLVVKSGGEGAWAGFNDNGSKWLKDNL